MAKQLLDTIKEAEQKAQNELEQTRAKADEMLAGRKEACETLEKSRAAEAAARSAETLAKAEADSQTKREQTLAEYRKQAESLRQTAGAKLPEAVRYVVGEVAGR